MGRLQRNIFEGGRQMIHLKNGDIMKLELVNYSGEQELVVNILNDKEEPQSRRRISSEELVSMIEEYIDKKENEKEAD